MNVFVIKDFNPVTLFARMHGTCIQPISPIEKQGICSWLMSPNHLDEEENTKDEDFLHQFICNQWMVVQDEKEEPTQLVPKIHLEILSTFENHN
jgi:hypothetical protein